MSCLLSSSGAIWVSSKQPASRDPHSLASILFGGDVFQLPVHLVGVGLMLASMALFCPRSSCVLHWYGRVCLHGHPCHSAAAVTPMNIYEYVGAASTPVS